MGTNDLNNLPIELLEQTDAAPASIGQSSLALVQNTLTEFDKVESGLADLRTKFKDVVFAVNTVVGMAEAKAARLDIRTPRYAVDKAAKAAKDPLNALKRDIDARALTITNVLVDLETPIHEQIKVEEDRVAAEKEAQKIAKAEAAAKIQTAIDGIRNLAVQAVGKTAADIDLMRVELEKLEPTIEDFADRSGEALQAKMQTLTTLDSLHGAAVAQEAQAAQAAADRAELEAMRAAQAERERIANEERAAEAAAIQAARDAASRLAAKELADQRAAFAREQEEARATRQAEEDRIAAQRAELARAEQAAEAARLAEQRQQEEAAAAERRATEARAQAERDEAARIEREAAAAEQRRLNEEAATRRAEQDRIAAEQRAAAEAAHKADQRGRDAWRVLLAALQGLINEAQPLGIERPTYQAGLKAVALVEGEAA